VSARDAMPSVEGRLLGRAATIGRVLTRYGFGELSAGGEPLRERAIKLRDALEELGPTFAKLGQILSTRPDLLPSEFIDELSRLQDRVPPLTEAQVVTVMEQELGVPWEDVFESIESSPLAAGTIGQVHRATLAGGERVVVKVQRPTARDEILRDLGLLEAFVEKTKNRPAFRQVIDLPAVLEHLSTSLRGELDFRQEAAQTERMREVLAPYARLEVPRVYQELSTDRVLVLQEVQGVPIRDAPASDARKEAAAQLLESFYRQILTEGFFHADPHPGNLMWWNDTIYFLDCGMVGELGPQMRELTLLLLMAFWQEDTPFLAEIVLLLAGEDAPESIDLEAFEAELGELLGRFRHSSLKEIQLGPMLQGLSEIATRHDVRLPASLALTGKALAQMQLAAADLDPALDPFDVVGRFLFRSFAGRLRRGSDPKRLYYEAEKLKTRIVRLTEALERVMGSRPGPRLRLEFTGTEPLERTIRAAGRRIALGMLAGCAVIGTAITAAGEVGKWVPIGLGALAAALAVVLLVDVARNR